jgi:DNA-binding GntR family transcriptional regulator
MQPVDEAKCIQYAKRRLSIVRRVRLCAQGLYGTRFARTDPIPFMRDREPEEALPSKTVKSHLVEVLQRAIMSGRFKPGERLNESKLARHYKVSRIPVREALLQLHEQGMVMNSPRRGMFVTLLSEEDCARINSLRIILEAEALKLCRAHFSGAANKHLSALVKKMERWKSGSEIAAAALDLEFHRAIWEYSGNEYLAKALNSLVPILFAHQAIDYMHNEPKRWPLDHHRPLLEVVQGKSQRTPEQAMTEHLSRRYTNPERFSSLALRECPRAQPPGKK